MKQILLFTTLLVFASHAQAQDCNQFKATANQAWKNKQYQKAADNFIYIIINDCGDAEKKTARQNIIKVFDEIEKLKIQAEKSEERANKALAKAEKMQRKLETALFDKAVKERYKEWKGYEKQLEIRQVVDIETGMSTETRYLDENAVEILAQIDTLNLSENGLFRLPAEVAECNNLKSINLLRNDLMELDSCFKIITHLPLTEIKISVDNLDFIPIQFWPKITGLDITGCMKIIPPNILHQSQLTYLDLSRNSCIGSQLENSELIFKLPNLKYLNLKGKEMGTINGIGNLINLSFLNLSDCWFSSLPTEIGNLSNLTSLDLWHASLTVLPTTIGNLTKLIFFRCYTEYFKYYEFN
jgi:Leucine-rich repeat (LRR) protein